MQEDEVTAVILARHDDSLELGVGVVAEVGTFKKYLRAGIDGIQHWL